MMSKLPYTAARVVVRDGGKQRGRGTVDDLTHGRVVVVVVVAWLDREGRGRPKLVAAPPKARQSAHSIEGRKMDHKMWHGDGGKRAARHGRSKNAVCVPAGSTGPGQPCRSGQRHPRPRAGQAGLRGRCWSCLGACGCPQMPSTSRTTPGRPAHGGWPEVPNFDTAQPDAHRSTRNLERRKVEHALGHECGGIGGSVGRSERGEPDQNDVEVIVPGSAS